MVFTCNSKYQFISTEIGESKPSENKQMFVKIKLQKIQQDSEDLYVFEIRDHTLSMQYDIEKVDKQIAQ